MLVTSQDYNSERQSFHSSDWIRIVIMAPLTTYLSGAAAGLKAARMESMTHEAGVALRPISVPSLVERTTAQRKQAYEELSSFEKYMFYVRPASLLDPPLASLSVQKLRAATDLSRVRASKSGRLRCIWRCLSSKYHPRRAQCRDTWSFR